jgi:release factor glutamine methyltransferase
MNAKALFDRLVQEITLPESKDEIQSIAFLLLAKLYGVSRTQVLANQPITEFDDPSIQSLIARVNQHEPIQYIVKEAWFYGRAFSVTPSVLIPRPETELLVELVVAEYNHASACSILDIGTGSGCIAVTLAKELPQAEVFAVDISNDALAIAGLNATALQATVFFDRLDVLHEPLPHRQLTAIVSNPPYVMKSESAFMHPNVLEHEPHVALFVPDNDALIFYTAIAKHAQAALLPDGKIFVEINEQLAADVCSVFSAHGFKNASIIKDLFGKDRVVVASVS